jgi:hypothetical protein
MITFQTSGNIIVTKRSSYPSKKSLLPKKRKKNLQIIILKPKIFIKIE